MKGPLLLFFLLIFGLLLSAAAIPIQAGEPDETPLGWPSANMEVDGLVPLHLVKRIAAQKAQSLWGEVTPGKPIPCCDEHGDIVAYMCPFRLGGGPFPAYAEIMDGVREGRRRKVEERERAFQQGSAGTEGKGAESFRKALNSAKKKEIGIGEYGTIHVSARYDQYPIPLCSHYLPPYYTKGDLAREKVRESRGGEPILGRYYFLGLRGQYFEFLVDREPVLIDARSLEGHSKLPGRPALPSAERLQDMLQDWNRLIGQEPPR